MENEELENLDSQNEEQENDDSSTVEEVEESESNEESSDEETTKEEYTEREKQLYARLKKAEKDLKAKKDDPKPAKSESESDRFDRLELKLAGVTDKNDQDTIIEYARFKGISVDEARESRAMKAELREAERQRLSESASPRNNNRAPGQQDEVGMWVKKYKKDGSLPDNNPALTSKILDALSNGA